MSAPTRSVLLITLGLAMALSTSLAVATPSQMNYQGQLRSSGALFTGTASMKFAILDGSTWLWSNDSTGSATVQPTASVSVPVSNGAFTVMLGAAPMKPLGPAVFATASAPVLRVWVNTGSGFEQLTDQTLVSVPFALQGQPLAGGWTGNNPGDVWHIGRVGIGTQSPTWPLDVITPNADDAFNGGIRISRANPGTTNLALGNYMKSANFRQGGLVLSDLSLNLVYGQAGAGFGFNIFRNTPENQIDTATPALSIDDQGRVGIGTSSPAATFDVAGTARAQVVEITGGDVAERFPIAEHTEPGMVLEIDATNPGHLRVCREPMSRNVAGVVSGAGYLHAGVLLGGASARDQGTAVALSGRVWVKADATERPIHVGDLLVTAARPGYAAAAKNPSKAAGRILGKAMSNLEAGTGLVLVLVSLQ